MLQGLPRPPARMMWRSRDRGGRARGEAPRCAGADFRPAAAGGCGRGGCARTAPASHVEVDDDAALAHQLAVERGDDDPAARGEHEVGLAGELVDHLRLAAAEARLALELEDGRNADAGARHDRLVAIGEAHPAPARQFLADRGLAGAHHADQYQTAHA